MADDELILTIDKAFWPKGIMRGLTPILRDLGDKHGNLVIAAVPNKHIMVKGPDNRIEEVKPALRELIEEHFPDAPIPEELGGEGEGDGEGEADAYMEEPEPPAPEPPAKTQPTPAPKKEVPPPVKTAAPSPAPKAVVASGAPSAAEQQLRAFVDARKRFVQAPGVPVAAPKRATLSKVTIPAGSSAAPVAGRKQPRPVAMASPDLIWECVRKSSSFLRKPMKEMKKTFSAEPCNLLALHCQKFSGTAASEALDVRPVKSGDKESIHLVQSHAKPSRHRRPGSALVSSGLSKCPQRGLERLDREIDGKFYRRDLRDLAAVKYTKVQKSFKKKKRAVKSRRAAK